MLPLDVYLEHEQEIVQKSARGIAEDFSTTVAAKLLRKDVKSRVVVNFNGVGLTVPPKHKKPTVLT